MEKIPECIGIIMDGNRRWAKNKNLLTLMGHQEGYETLKKCVRWAKEKGIKYIIFYAFSTENWKRSEEEVGYLMNMFRRAILNEVSSLKEEDVKIRFIGKKEMLDLDIREGMLKLENETRENNGPTVVLAVSYGGRLEIIEALNKAIDKGEKVSEESFGGFLWTEGIPDPELIIRTGGEKRLSNFLPWQSIYSEVFFVDTLWPDFSKEEFEKILRDYSKIERKNGK